MNLSGKINKLSLFKILLILLALFFLSLSQAFAMEQEEDDELNSGSASSRSFSASSSQSSNPHREPPETDAPPSSSSPTDLSVIHSLVTGIDCSTEECSKDFSEQISQELPRLVNLRILILDDIFSINRMGSLPSFFSNILASVPPSIEILSMNDNLFHESSWAAVMGLFPPTIPQLPLPLCPAKLTKRELTEDQQRHFGGLLSDISGPIRRFQNLRVLRMANVYKNCDFFFPIAELLASLPAASLEELDLRGTSFSVEDLKFLANDEEVTPFRNLKILKLSKAGIDNGERLARFLKQTQLQEFTFIDSPNEAGFFIEFLKELSTRRAEWQESDILSSLVKLDISNNKEIGNAEDTEIQVSPSPFFTSSSTFFDEILKFKHLKELNITDDNIEGDLIKDFVDRISSYNGLPNLQYIGCLEGNDISTERQKNKPDYQGIFESGHEVGMEDIPRVLPSQQDEIKEILRRLKRSKGDSFDWS